MNFKADELTIELNISLRGKRYYIRRNRLQRLDARKFGYAKAWFKTCAEAGSAIAALVWASNPLDASYDEACSGHDFQNTKTHDDDYFECTKCHAPVRV
jgi:hypothetical protein